MWSSTELYLEALYVNPNYACGLPAAAFEARADASASAPSGNSWRAFRSTLASSIRTLGDSLRVPTRTLPRAAAVQYQRL
jgi:hypothetical protein